MKTWGNGGIAPPFLTSALDEGEWSASRLGSLLPRKEPPVPIGGPQSRSGDVEKIVAPAGNRTPAVQPIAHWYTDWAKFESLEIQLRKTIISPGVRMSFKLGLSLW
jgi:hypothetical protein